MTELISRLKSEITQFFEVYTVLSPEGRAVFEAQMGPMLQKSDNYTSSLYRSLLQSAQRGRSIEEAIDELNKLSVQNGKTNKPG